METPILDIFNNFKMILCMCPHCNVIVRLNELNLRTKTKSPKTWLDQYELKIDKAINKEDKFAEQEKELREQAHARGRAQVKKLVLNSMSKEFAQLNFDPYDIKALLHPIDFVVFNGMNNESVKDVVLLSRKTQNPILQTLHQGVSEAVQSKSYDWTTIKVSQDGTVNFE